MIYKRIKALLVEDDPGDAYFIQELFSDTSGSDISVKFTHVDCLAKALDCLTQKRFDLILLDLSLPDSQGAGTFDRLYAAHNDIPIVILTGLDDKQTAISVLQKGAQDYLIKGEVDRDLLERPIHYSIERHQLIKTMEKQQKEIEGREKYYRSLMNCLHEDIIVIDRDYNVMDINNTFLRTTGHKRERCIGQKCYTLFHKLDTPCNKNDKTCLKEKVFKTGKSESFVNQFTNKDNEKKWIDILLSPLAGEDGKVTHIIETVRDITDILKTKEELSQSEQKYYRLLNSLNEGVWVIDRDARTEYVTTRMAMLLGYSEEEMLGKHLFDFIQEEDATLCTEYLKRREKGIREIHDFVFLKKDNRKMYALMATTPIFNEDGEYTGSVAGILDITERKIAENKLEQSEKLYHSLIENLPVHVFRKDLEGRFTFVNTRFCELIGKPAEEILEKTDYDFYPAELADKYRRDDLHVVQSKTHFETEEQNRTIQGQEIRVNVIKSPILDANGDCIGMQGISWDISEKVKLQEQLLQSQKMQAIGQLAGGIAHDFNNILMVIKSYSDFVLNQLPEDNDMRSDVLEIKNAGNRAASLTRQLHAFSRRQVIRPEEIKLDETIDTMEKMLHRLIGEDIELITQIDPNLGFIKIDPGQAEQIIMNMAVNARDAMPNGGQLMIAVQNQVLRDDYHNHLCTIPAGEYVTLTISDKGVGMTHEIQQRIFEPFYTTKEKGKGTGLGLSTVYGIVQQNHGYLTLQSELGKGTVFTLYFNRIYTDRELKSEPSQDLGSLHGLETILIVEDDLLVRKLLKRGLTEYGYTVLLAENGVDAIRICKGNKHAIDLLLTDVVMPGMNGRELADQIQILIPNIKRIFMSGYADDAMLRMGILAQDNIYIQKPFTLETILKTIRGLLDE